MVNCRTTSPVIAGAAPFLTVSVGQYVAGPEVPALPGAPGGPFSTIHPGNLAHPGQLGRLIHPLGKHPSRVTHPGHRCVPPPGPGTPLSGPRNTGRRIVRLPPTDAIRWYRPRSPLLLLPAAVAVNGIQAPGPDHDVLHPAGAAEPGV